MDPDSRMVPVDQVRSLLSDPQSRQASYSARKNPVHIKEEKWRWVIIVSYLLTSSIMGLMVSSTQSIASSLKMLYGVQSWVVSLYPSSFFFSCLIFNFPASYIISNHSVSLSLKIGVICGIIGVWIRCFINQSFGVSLFGQCIGAIGMSFFFNAPSQISQNWFAPQNRGLSTLIMSQSFLIFSSFGAFLPMFVVDKEPSQISQSEYQTYRNWIGSYFFYEACFCSFAGFLGILLYREYPTRRQAITSENGTRDFCGQTKKAFCHFSFILCLVSLSLLVGSYNCLQSLGEMILKKYGVTSYNYSVIEVVYIPVALLFTLIFGCWQTRTLKYKIILCGTAGMLFILALLLIPFVRAKNLYAIAAIMFLQTGFITPSVGLTMELAAEITYPISAGLTAGLVVVSDKLSSFILTEGLSPLIDKGKQETILAILIVLQGIAFIAILFVHEELRRSHAERQKLLLLQLGIKTPEGQQN